MALRWKGQAGRPGLNESFPEELHDWVLIWCAGKHGE